MKTAAEYVSRYLWNFINQLGIDAPNSAVADNCRRAAEAMVDAAIAEERERCAAEVRRYRPRTGPTVRLRAILAAIERDDYSEIGDAP